jgi:hypothetical protein
MAMTFAARLTTQHTLKYTAIALDMAEPAKLLPTGRDAAPQGPPARVVTIRSLKVSAVWRLWEVSPETTAPLTDLEQMAYGVTNQQVTENGVSFDLGVLDHFRPLEQLRIHATVRYDPQTATCTPIVQTTIQGQVAALERVYVQADERLIRPKVLYIDVVGRSLTVSPTHVTERIQP